MRSLVVVSLLLLSAVLAPAAETPVWWSLTPLAQPTPPTIDNPLLTTWARNPIDRFVLARLQAKGLTPSPEADRRTLLRRVTFDLTGLPPTPEALNAFLRDTGPDAYEKVVDGLLTSPRYGERWARHWMDAVHFAETHGHDQDRPRPNAWPYRDYLIHSFNDDKPYPRFVKEQLAGDVLYPEDPLATTALGMLAAGPWDESSLRDIREDTPDREIARYLDRDDMVTTALSTFVSLTVGCARCHDHKFDPISLKEYYGLQAVFAGVDKAERTYEPDAAVGRRRAELTRRLGELGRLRGKSDPSFRTAQTLAAVKAWEKEAKAKGSQWQTLEPVEVQSTAGSTLRKLPDGSVLAEGTRPETDTYVVTMHTDEKEVRGLRLEVLPHESLPKQGPGRQDNGNLHLSTFRVVAVSKKNREDRREIPIKRAAADFNQDGWTIEMAIDNKNETAWGIFPAVGQPHHAVFEFRDPVGHDGGTEFRIDLSQYHGRHHLIGRFRLSLTTKPGVTLTADVAPPEIAAILALPANRRSDVQKDELARYVLEQTAKRDLASLPPPGLVYAAARDFQPDGSFRPAGKPRAVQVLRRGDLNRAGDLAVPGALSCVPGLEHRFPLANPDDEGARRVALAEWVAHRDNPLTWRSIVNRIWHHHFGRGIVDTPNDFGQMGGRPSHPELLDWLAVEFRDVHQGSLKKLHRLIVTSATYRQSSQHDAKAAAIDADNRLLWRRSRTRLDAESVRDAVLQLSGKLDLTMYGPSVKQFIQKPGIHVTPLVDYASFDVDRPENHRRSVYRFLFRTLPDPFMEALDCADSSQLTPVRNTSMSALQALALWNNKFMVRQSEHLAERLKRSSPNAEGQVREAFRLVLLREPTAAELKDVVAYASKHGLANACRVLLNSNEFQFVN